MEAAPSIMATKLNIVAQYAMDAYLGQYRVQADFFTINDFIFHCAASAASFYQQLYEREYTKLRADGQKDEVVAFSNDFLNTQILEVKKKDGETFAELKEQVFSFAWDSSNVGVQNVFCSKPAPQYELERSDIDEIWQLKYTPKNNLTFWALDGGRILLINNGTCNVKEIKVLYVPQITADNPEALLPDAIVSPVINTTVAAIRELRNGAIVKKTNDNNENKVLQSELNIQATK